LAEGTLSGWVFEGGHKVEEALTDGLVFVFSRWGGAGAWVDGWERCRTCPPGHVLRVRRELEYSTALSRTSQVSVTFTMESIVQRAHRFEDLDI